GGGGGGDESRKLISVRLMAKERTLHGKKASQQFIVIGQYADKRERDLTGEARFTLSNPGLVRFDESGRAFAVADGETALTAKVDGLSAQASLKVDGSAVDRPFSFARDVIGVFTRRGCNSAGCHGGIKGQAGFKLSTHGIHPKEDYKWIVEGGVFQVLSENGAGEKKPRIDVKNPEQSLILQKASMSVAHGGGLRIQKGSEDFEAIVNWIRAGATYGAEDKASNPK